MSTPTTLAAPLVLVPRPAHDRIHATLLRRIDACATRRTAAALDTPIPAAFATWLLARDRGDRLRCALIHHLAACS